jgi:DNA-binding NtrC family response regulator
MCSVVLSVPTLTAGKDAATECDNNTEMKERVNRQIIIANRDTQFRDALKRVCSGRGCRVETSNSVATALEIAGRRRVCILVVDASIQDVGDGVGLAKAIHEQSPDAKCFLIVDRDSTDDSSSADNEPWLRFVHKPISMLRFSADLVDVIAKSKEEMNP